MRASSFRYLVKNGVHNLWSNRMMTIASVGTLVACLLIVGFAVLFSINVDSIVAYVGQQNEVVVFMQMDTPLEYMDTMKRGRISFRRNGGRGGLHPSRQIYRQNH